MVQLNIAFLDEEEDYLEQLQGYVIRKKDLFFKIAAFSKAEAFLVQEKEQKFDAVVMTEVFWEALEGTAADTKKILLYEEDGKDVNGRLFLEKYQSAEQLFQQISAMLWQEETDGRAVFIEHTAKLIGIYSPIRHESQLLFSMTMAQILGETQKVLYVNLMEHSGFSFLTNEEITEDIGDLLYAMMQKNHDFAAGLHKIRRTYRNVDYIPPAVNPEHISEITKPLLEELFLILKGRSGYDIVVVDFDRVFLGFAEMIPVFGGFYCLGKEGRLNRYRMTEFMEYLRKEGEYTVDLVKHILLPEMKSSPTEAGLLDEGIYGGMGDYIRGCLYGGAEIGR